MDISAFLFPTFTFYVFIEEVGQWPNDNASISTRIQVVRMLNETGRPTNGEIKSAQQGLGNIELMVRLAQLENSKAQIEDYNIDLVLVGEKPDANGIIMGRLSGTMIGSPISDVSFVLSPWTTEDLQLK